MKTDPRHFTQDEWGRLVLALYRETPYPLGRIERDVNMLRAVGWTPHQARRAVLISARTGLGVGVVWRATEVSLVGIDETLDAFTPA